MHKKQKVDRRVIGPQIPRHRALCLRCLCLWDHALEHAKKLFRSDARYAIERNGTSSFVNYLSGRNSVFHVVDRGVIFRCESDRSRFRFGFPWEMSDVINHRPHPVVLAELVCCTKPRSLGDKFVYYIRVQEGRYFLLGVRTLVELNFRPNYGQAIRVFAFIRNRKIFISVGSQQRPNLVLAYIV